MLCLPILLLAASLGWAVNSLWLYKYGFQTYGVSQTLAASGLELSDPELEEVYAGISLFWRRRKYWRQLALAIVGGSGITLALMLALGLGTLSDFGQLFYQFHLLFFTNEFWSAEGYMLLLFPQPFFFDAALLCALATVMLAIILGGISGSYLLLSRSKTKH